MCQEYSFNSLAHNESILQTKRSADAGFLLLVYWFHTFLGKERLKHLQSAKLKAVSRSWVGWSSFEKEWSWQSEVEGGEDPEVRLMFNTEEKWCFCWWTLVGLSLPFNTTRCSTFVLTLITAGDHQIIITGLLFFFFKKRFFSPHKCNIKPSESVAIKGIWMSQRRLLAQRSDVTLETPENMAFKSRSCGWHSLRLMLLSDMKTTIEFPSCDCGSNRAETPGGALSSIQPQKVHFCLLSFHEPSHLKVSDWLDSFAPVSSSVLQHVRGGFTSQSGEDAWEGYDDGEGGLAHAEHQSLQRCHVLPCHTVHPCHRRAWEGKTHTQC